MALRLRVYLLIAFFAVFLLLPFLFSFYGIREQADPVSVSMKDFSFPDAISVFQTDTGRIITLTPDECVARILADEKLLLSSKEGLKSLAVAARSYLLHQIFYSSAAESTHPNAMLCDSETHCFKLSASPIPAEVQQAMNETSGEYLAYDGLPAKACYFNISSGKTESSLHIWDADLPYLVSVDSQADKDAVGYHSRVIYPLEAFQLVIQGTKKVTDTKSAPIISEVSCTENGYVKSIIVLGAKFTGQEIQKLFHLKSTNFTVEIHNTQVIFDVKGDGHGVGMSKFGAKQMADSGNVYRDILAHYYPNTALIHKNTGKL